MRIRMREYTDVEVEERFRGLVTIEQVKPILNMSQPWIIRELRKRRLLGRLYGKVWLVDVESARLYRRQKAAFASAA